MKNILESPLAGLTLITSCGCNLDCEYCRIAQARRENSNSATLQANTIKALQDGTFISNTKQVLYNLGQAPSNITSIAFWGQEPTLTLNLFAEHMDDWFAAFPNWSTCTFSTNAIAHMDRLYDFITAIDATSNHPFNLEIQLSYDGEDGTTNSRKTSGDNIHNNVMQLFDRLNSTKLKRVKVAFHFHAVLSLDLIHKLQTPEAIINYQRSLVLWTNEFAQYINNKNIRVDTEMDLGLENPVQACAMDGIALHRLCDLSKRLNPLTMLPSEFFKEENTYYTVASQATRGAYRILDVIDELTHNMFGLDKFDDLIHVMTDDPKARRDFLRQLNPMCYCGNGVGEIKLLYDGTLVNCQNHIFDLDLEQLPYNPNSLEASVKRSLVQHKYFINPLTDSEEDIIKYFDLFNNMNFTSFEFIFRSTIALMSALVQVGQIDSSYADPHKLIKHGLILAVIGCCSYNNQMMTGSVYLRHSGFIRFYCNGFLDDCIECFNSMHGREVI